MIMFQNDYVEGAHPAVLQKLIDTNMEQSVGKIRTAKRQEPVSEK